MTMYKPMIAATLLAFAGMAQAQAYPPPEPPPDNAHFGWADVLRVDPIYVADAGGPPRQECYDQQVTREDNSHVGGTVLGAIVGGALGNQVGKGDGRKAATIAGAVAGGAIGNGISRAHDRSYTDVETHCRMVNDYPPHRRIAAYDVEYRYRGEVYVSRLGYDPGERLRVRVSVTPAE
jgi:uncharacterized protein YcfJ